MKLSTTSQYAIRVMIFIAQNPNIKLFHAKDISEKLSIPYKYLTKIMSKLVEANIITSIRGREGGYSIAKKSVNIKMIDLVKAVDDSLHDTTCVLGIGLCNENKKCALHDEWREPKESMLKMFCNTTLEDVSKEAS